MQFPNFFVCFFVLRFNFTLFSNTYVFATPGGKNGDTASVYSVSSATSSRSRIAGGATINVTGGVVLDFDASQVSSDIIVNDSIPGILKYEPNSGKKINKIKCSGHTLDLVKKVKHVFCASPFDENVTVVFEDGTTSEYQVQPTGFVLINGEADPNADQSSQAQANLVLLQLDLLNPSNKFKYVQVGNVKCYKPVRQSVLVSKISLNDIVRNVETDVLENFICVHEENGDYSILVAYFSREKRWLKYTLSKRSQSGAILMDVSLMRKFDDIILDKIFADQTTPYDDKVFVYDNLKINKNDTGVLKSDPKGNLKFILEVTDVNAQVTKVNMTFATNFIVQEGFTFHTIRSKSNYEHLMFTYVSDNVILHEKYTLINNLYTKDVTAVNKHDLKRSKAIVGKENMKDENVLFYTTLVPDSVEQGVKVSHHGKFKVFDFEKSSRETFVIFPNIEFYLDKDADHKLVLCENGETINLVMKTVSNNNKVDYIASTDPLKGNPLAMKAVLKGTPRALKYEGTPGLVVNLSNLDSVDSNPVKPTPRISPASTQQTSTQQTSYQPAATQQPSQPTSGQQTSTQESSGQQPPYDMSSTPGIIVALEEEAS